MEFEWDQAKDAANRAKHGVGLGEAVRLDWSQGVTLRDQRTDYGEQRYLRYALLDNRLHTCAFTLRGQRLRIISLRKSNGREIRKYGESAIQTDDQ